LEIIQALHLANNYLALIIPRDQFAFRCYKLFLCITKRLEDCWVDGYNAGKCYCKSLPMTVP